MRPGPAGQASPGAPPRADSCESAVPPPPRRPRPRPLPCWCMWPRPTAALGVGWVGWVASLLLHIGEEPTVAWPVCPRWLPAPGRMCSPSRRPGGSPGSACPARALALSRLRFDCWPAMTLPEPGDP